MSVTLRCLPGEEHLGSEHLGCFPVEKQVGWFWSAIHLGLECLGRFSDREDACFLCGGVPWAHWDRWISVVEGSDLIRGDENVNSLWRPVPLEDEVAEPALADPVDESVDVPVDVSDGLYVESSEE